MITKENIAATYQMIQDEICAGLERLDGKALFAEELWEREGGGGGRTRVISNGNILEKGGVNFSSVHGQLPAAVKKSFHVEVDDFFATGVSIVIHPSHPLVPIIHMNIRYFEMNNEIRWFGGGIDVTPHYIFEHDAAFFHRYIKNTCDQFSGSFYHEFKKWADDYFYIRHREETRGIGGIFYDRLTPEKTGLSWEKIFDFSVAVGRSFLPVYTELLNRNRSKPFGEKEKQWQYLRRGRYAEFNLIYDAGTRFGLETHGRIESILMSLPPQANWPYNPKIEKNSMEEKTLHLLKKGVNWVDKG